MNDEIEKFVYEWLEYRTPKQDYNNIEGYSLAKEYIANYYEHTKDKEGYELFKKAVDNFFIKNDDWRITTKSINFKDFALSNILYSSIANMHSNSMNIAGTIMANILGIKDNVHTISDTNGWLYGITESGKVLKLFNMGFPDPNNPSLKSDYIITVQCNIPKLDELADKQKMNIANLTC